jgi:hypothetical protein
MMTVTNDDQQLMTTTMTKMTIGYMKGCWFETQIGQLPYNLPHYHSWFPVVSIM